MFRSLILLVLWQASLGAAEFTEIAKEKLEALKAADNPAQWSELMPEGQSFTFAEREDQALPLYFFPAAGEPTQPGGVLVLFAGGAFRNGSPTGFYRQALDYSANGLPVVLVKYRGTERDGASVIDAYRDGHDALIWVREHAEELGIDPGKVLAGGSSAGAMLALALATVDSLHEEVGHRKGVPDGLLLFDPGGGAIATAPIEGDPHFGPEPPGRWKWYSKERFGADPRSISPFHHLDTDLPPAAMFVGGRENEKTRHGAWLLFSKATELGALWDLHFYADMPHAGMVNSATWQPEVYRAVIENALRFCRRHGFTSSLEAPK